MDAPVSNAVSDKLATVLLGVHSGLAPSVLPPNQLAFAINITCRGGFPRTRPPIRKLTLLYADTDTRDAVTGGRWQGAAYYRAYGNNANCLVASISGRLFRFRVVNTTAHVDEITPKLPSGALDINDPNAPQVWMAQGQEFLVINDGLSNPWFFDGGGVRRSGGYAKQELPPGKQLHYCNGRFIEVMPDGNSYIASDLVYNTSSGTAFYQYRDSILRITDNVAILAGAPFAVPLTAGAITALFSVAIPDTSLGQGPLQIGTEEGVFSVLLPLDATLWTTTQQPTQTVSLPNGGPTGQLAATTVNGDAWYRAGDGLRSFVTARRDFNTWVQTPLSFEMSRVLDYDSEALLAYASVVRFDNRLLATCSPYNVRDRGVAHRGLVALDFNNISSLTTRAQPAYDGLWTGLPILQAVVGKFASVERCFLFALTCASEITLYELGVDNSAWFDFDGESNVRTACSLETGTLFGRESDPDRITQQFKRLHTADLFLDELAGTVDFNLSYISDQYPCWVAWKAFTLCATACVNATDCIQPVPVRKQYATFKRLPEPADTCNPITGTPFRMGYSFQLRVAWTGHAELRRLNAWASPSPATRNVVCGTETCKLLQCCGEDLFAYSIERCNSPVCDIVITVQPHIVTMGGEIEWDVSADAPVIDVSTGGTITSIPDTGL